MNINGSGATNLPAALTNGAPVRGLVRYTVPNSLSDSNPSPETGDYQFPAQQQTIQITVGTNVFESNPSRGTSITVINDGSGSPVSDRLTYATSFVLLNGGPMPGAPDTSFLGVDLDTTNLTALASDALPQSAPTVSQFVVNGTGGYRLITGYTYKSGAFFYGFSVQIAALIPLPEIQMTRQGSVALLTWPTNAASFALQTATNISGPWSFTTNTPTVTNSAYYLAVPVNGSSRFYRLAIEARP